MTFKDIREKNTKLEELYEKFYQFSPLERIMTGRWQPFKETVYREWDDTPTEAELHYLKASNYKF